MSIEELISGLEELDPRGKKKACKALGELGDQQAVPRIIRLLENSELDAVSYTHLTLPTN